MFLMFSDPKSKLHFTCTDNKGIAFFFLFSFLKGEEMFQLSLCKMKSSAAFGSRTEGNCPAGH